ncbi:MAG: hypothetical protein AAGL24_06035 [Pseudomonadota bacterium]
MSRFSRPGHLIGLALLVGLVAALYLYWPWPLSFVQSSAPDFFKTQVRPLVRDYQDLIAYLFPFLVLSVIHALWSWVNARFSAPPSS